MARKFGKKNHVKIDPFSYSLMLLGEPKVGKTTLLYEVAEKLVGEDGYIFAELYREQGADAIEGIVAESIPSWEDWTEFVDDIVDNKSVDYTDLRVVFVDTYDQYILLAEQEALRLWNKKNPDKRVDSLNAAWNGFGAGSKKAIELMFEQIDRLESVGVKVWFIGHVKTKEVKNIYNDETYTILTSDQQQNYFNALKKNLHFLCLAYFDRELQKEKTGKKNIVTKKDEMKTIIKDEVRKIKFRDDSFVVDSGSRFSHIKQEIDFDADEFINAIVDAIKYEIESKGKSLDERKTEEAEIVKENARRIADAEAANKAKRELESAISNIVAYCSENARDMDKVMPVVMKIRTLGYESGNPNDIASLADAMSVIEVFS